MSKTRKYKYQDDLFTTLNNNKAYLAGFIAADGCLFKQRGVNKLIRIGLSWEDVEHLYKLQNLFNTSAKVIKNKLKTGLVRADLTIYSDQIFDDLVKLNITPNKQNRHYPPNIEEKFVPHFIRGLFDGDGCFCICKTWANTLTMTASIAGTKEIVTWVRGKFSSFYGKDTGYLYKMKNANLHQISFSTKAARYFGDWIYKDSEEGARLTRKYVKYIHMNNYMLSNRAERKVMYASFISSKKTSKL